jgi:hypothetical protein
MKEANLGKRMGVPPFTMQWRGKDGKAHSFYYGRYEPIATSLGTNVDIIKHIKLMKAGMPASEALSSFAAHMAGQFTEKSFGRGLDMLAKLVAHPIENGADWLSHMASSFVPNIITQPTRNFDPYERDGHIEAGDTKSLLKQFFAKTVNQALPFIANQPPKVDVYGRDSAKNGSGIFRTLAPGNPHEVMEIQKADKLLTNWRTQSVGKDEEGPAKDWLPGQLARTYHAGGKTITMGEQEYHDFQQTAGKLAMERLRGRITQSMIDKPTSRDVVMIQHAFADGSRQARDQVKAKHPIQPAMADMHPGR